MSVTLINGDGNPRVLASQDADWYGALTGQKTCIVPINDNLSATITDSNTIEISSGVCITKEGRRVQIDEGDIEEIIIPTGTQGADTYYIIGFHLYINELGQQVAETFVETMANATDTITETTFKEGSSSIYVSLYRVKRSGLLMDSVTQIIPTLKTIVDINDTIGSTDISAIGDGTVTGGLSRINSDLSKHTLGTPHGFSSGETYVSTEDGYVNLFSNGGYCEVYFGAASMINAFKGTYASRNSLFVRKGTSMRYYTEDGNNTACTFYPLV